MSTRYPPSAIRIEGDVAYISLSKGMEAVIDVADLPLVQGRRWRAEQKKPGHCYAFTQVENNKPAAMHRMLVNAPHGMHVDHIDNDGLNNRRSNLRCCSRAENAANTKAHRRNKLGVKGVWAQGKKYRAVITPNGRPIHLGSFLTIEEASEAYLKAARGFWGDFANGGEAER